MAERVSTIEYDGRPLRGAKKVMDGLVQLTLPTPITYNPELVRDVEKPGLRRNLARSRDAATWGEGIGGAIMGTGVYLTDMGFFKTGLIAYAVARAVSVTSEQIARHQIRKAKKAAAPPKA